MSLQELQGTGAGQRAPSKEPVDDGLDARMAEGIYLFAGGEDYYSNFNATECAEFAGLLEQAGPAFGESNLQVAFFCHFCQLDLLAALAFPHHWINGEEGHAAVDLDRRLV